MLRTIVFLSFLVPAAAFAQSATDNSSTMSHGSMDHSRMHAEVAGPSPTEPGQSAFAAIQEIALLLESDPHTHWSKVTIDALRNHLADMDAVTLHAKVEGQPVEGGMKFVVTGGGPVAESIRRMLTAHAATMSGVNGWQLTAVETAEGAVLTVIVPPKDQMKLRGLGLFGVLTVGMHHQEHHLMIARGDSPHH